MPKPLSLVMRQRAAVFAKLRRERAELLGLLGNINYIIGQMEFVERARPEDLPQCRTLAEGNAHIILGTSMCFRAKRGLL